MSETIIDAQMKAAVEEVVDALVLSSYTVRLNLILRLSSDEKEDEPTLIQAQSGELYSLAFPFTGVKVKVNPTDVEPTRARGYLSSHLLKVMGALNQAQSKTVVRIGTERETHDYYLALANMYHAAATRVLPTDVPQLTAVTEVTKDELEDGTCNYTIDVYFSFEVNGAHGFESVEKWGSKIVEQADKFNVPFRFTVAVPFDDMNLVMPIVGASLLNAGYVYSHTGSEVLVTPIYRGNAMGVFGKQSDGVRPHAFFTLTF